MPTNTTWNFSLIKRNIALLLEIAASTIIYRSIKSVLFTLLFFAVGCTQVVHKESSTTNLEDDSILSISREEISPEAFDDVRELSITSRKLRQPSEYKGALLDNNYDVFIYSETGLVSSAVLKKDFSLNGVTYKSGTVIVFHNNGNVLGGTPKENASIQGQIIGKNKQISFHKNGNLRKAFVVKSHSDNNFNLNIPENVSVSWTKDGYVSSVIYNQLTGHRLLDWECTREIRVTRAPQELNYVIKSCQFSRPSIIAKQIIEPSPHQNGNPEYGSVVVSKNTIGTYFYEFEGYPSDHSLYVDQNFRFGDYEFKRCQLYVTKEHEILYFQIFQPLDIDGVHYPARSLLTFDDHGKPVAYSD
ncbi:hypothetical protein [Gilvimarinus algae]|uniref:Lipoprotein n=1 Tax=Gilvimarinus algae TaxID=3058037 RepID=A0ABT8TEM0_9GAMM|nr:hypothetical protein [Gilvimarinus sp. SDUM040014]MDO3381523.1 hypothetical protein [Gilvimarinus sp. SDUM040014]